MLTEDLLPNSITSLSKLPLEYKRINSTLALNCPVSPADLSYVKVVYWSFDKKDHVGALIVNKALASEILEIFKTLHANKFPIERILPISEYKNNDDDSMLVNNTYSFSCREVTGQPGIFSQHSYGRAIDINPKINPYVKSSKNIILPPDGIKFVDRKKAAKGMITRDSLIYKVFTEHGWDWGGNWNDLQDYQHFEKRANGEKRNPDGYL